MDRRVSWSALRSIRISSLSATILWLCALEFILRADLLLGRLALFQRDVFLLYFPLIQSALRAVAEGALPLRDPSSGFGQPLLGDPSSQILYPPVGLYFFMPPHLAYAWFNSLHSIFGAIGIALLARRLAGGSSLAGFVGGTVWLSCGPLDSLATLWHHMAGAAWVPWVLLAVDRAEFSDRGRSAMLIGVAFGGQMLAGSADMCATSGLLAIPFAVRSGLFRHIWTWLVGGGIAIALSAGMWMPALELVLNSARSALPEDIRTGWSLHPYSVFEIFLPVLLADLPLKPEWRAVMFEGHNAFLGSVFMGILVIPLGCAALVDTTVRRSARLACFLGALGGVLTALGKNAVFYSWAITLVPPLRILRFPSKAMIGVAVLLSVLAGIGASSIGRSARSRLAALFAVGLLLAGMLVLFGGGLSRVSSLLLAGLLPAQAIQIPQDLLLATVLLGLLGVAVAFRLSGRLAVLFAVVLVAGHLLQSARVHKDFNLTVPASVLAYKPPFIDSLRPSPGGRLYAYDYGLVKGLARKHLGRDEIWDLPAMGIHPNTATVIAGRATLTPLTGAFWGLEYAWDGDLRLLFDRRLAALTAAVISEEGTPVFLRLLQIAGVERVFALHDKGMEALRPMARYTLFRPDDLRVFEVPNPLPRAFLTSGRLRGAGLDLLDLANPRFDPTRMALVDSGSTTPPSPGFEGRTKIVDRRADRLTVETDSNQPGLLTVLEGSLPGWRVWVDGQPGVVLRTNAIFIGTDVPAGRHLVEFRYLPLSAIVGVTMTALTGLVLLVALLRARPSPDPSTAL